MTVEPNAQSPAGEAPMAVREGNRAALIGVIAGVAFAACSVLPAAGAAMVFLVLALALAWGWPQLLDIPSPKGTSGVIAATALALCVIVLASGADARVRWAGAVVSVGLLGSFLHQLTRNDGRPRLVWTLAGTALALGLLGSGSYLIADASKPAAHHLIGATGLAITAAAGLEYLTHGVHRTPRFVIPMSVVAMVFGLFGVLFGASFLLAALAGVSAGILYWACLRLLGSLPAAGGVQAGSSAVCAATLACGFLPFALAQFS